MRNLCDSNVLLALVSSHHPHHQSAEKWLDGMDAEETLAVCRLAQLTFLRLLTLEAVMKEKVRTNLQAARILNALMDNPRFVFIAEEPAGFGERWLKWGGLPTASHNSWMDAYLAALAKGLGCRLVTFDKGFAKWQKEGLDLLLLS